MVAAAAVVVAAAAAPVAGTLKTVMQAKSCHSQIGMRPLQSLQNIPWALDGLIEVTLSGDWTVTWQYVGGRQERVRHIL